MKKLNEKQLKEQYFEELFTQHVKKFATETDGKFIDVTTKSTNKSLEIFFNKLYSKYKVKNNYNDFLNECIYWTYFAIQRFTVRDGGSWEGMIGGTDKANIGRLITSIKTTVEHEVIRFINDGVIYTSKRDEEGKVEHAKYKFTFSSLDAILMGAEGEETSLINMVGDEQGFWGNKEGYASSHFIQWFNENKERVLTASQLQLLDNLSKCSHEKDGYTENDISQYVGFNSKKVGEYLERIKGRVMKAWRKENSLGQKTQLELMKDAEVELWTSLIDLVYTEDTAGQNKAISDWFIAHLDNDKVANMVYDHIDKEASIAVTNAYVNRGGQTAIPSKVIYTLVAKVEDRLDYLQQLETESVKFYKKETEMGRWTPQAHKEHAQGLKAWKEQTCKVYKRNEDGSLGELVREEAWKPFKQKTNGVQEVLPTGVIVSKVE